MACWRLEGKHRPEENAKNYIILICRGGTSSVLHDSAHPSFLVNTAGISASGSLPEEVYINPAIIVLAFLKLELLKSLDLSLRL